MVGGFMADYLKRWVSGVVLVATLLGCSSSAVQSGSWEIYRNARYGFEFPYPDNWVAGEAPVNGDGQVFSDRQNPALEMRGWAGYNLVGDVGKEGKNIKNNKNNIDSPKPLQENFTTEQGVVGELKVELGDRVSSMTLTLVRGDVRYNFQGKAPSKQFADYYKFFYYVASQYRISPPLK
ncbi:hypothetical protein BCD67_18095 [Oscillatoriales cyanobacterium USR001]|nr:hypothetical protein BCD67_18095 [Oscillatoriales cyanobacterium USR001]